METKLTSLKLPDILKPENGKFCITDSYWAINSDGEIIHDETINYYFCPMCDKDKNALVNKLKSQGVDLEKITILLIPLAYTWTKIILEDAIKKFELYKNE